MITQLRIYTINRGQLRQFARETLLTSGVISEDDIAFVHPVSNVDEALQFIRA